MTHARPGFDQTSDQIKSCQTVEEAVFALRDSYSVTHVTYHLAQTIVERLDAPFVRTTYPSEWVSQYLQKNYVKIDPVIREGTLRLLPFEWSEIELTPEALPLFVDAQKHGLGASGYSIPVVDKFNRRALLTINDVHSGVEWREMLQANHQDWAELAHQLHKLAVAEIYGESDPAIALSPRELECLTWAARGKDYKDISTILEISSHTALGYFKSARFKLDSVNLSQAVSKAIKLRLINP